MLKSSALQILVKFIFGLADHGRGTYNMLIGEAVRGGWPHRIINWQYGLAIFVGLEVAVGEMKELTLPPSVVNQEFLCRVKK